MRYDAAHVLTRLPHRKEPPDELRLLAFAFALLFGSPAFAANPTIEVWKSTTCECCGNWVKHLEANGFDVR